MTRMHVRRRTLAMFFIAVLTATVALTMASMSTAWADTAKCDPAAFADSSGYLACLMDSGASGDVSSPEATTGDLPVTGTNPVKTLVLASAFIVVGAAAVVGSTQAKRRTKTASF